MTRVEVRAAEFDLECRVSRYIGTMPFLWLGVDDPAGPESMCGIIERNSIALLSNYPGDMVDLPSAN